MVHETREIRELLVYYNLVREDTGEYYSSEGGYGSNVGVKWTRNGFHAALYSSRNDTVKMLQLLKQAGYKVKLA